MNAHRHAGLVASLSLAAAVWGCAPSAAGDSAAPAPPGAAPVSRLTAPVPQQTAPLPPQAAPLPPQAAPEAAPNVSIPQRTAQRAASVSARPDGGVAVAAAAKAPGATTLELDLTFEYRNTAHLSLEVDGDMLTGTLTVGEGYGNDLIAAGTPVQGTGRLLHFPEAGYEIYGLELSGPAVPDGPCGDSPIAYGLTLSGQSGASERMGGIAPYCGTSTRGRPQRMLRINGAL